MEIYGNAIRSRAYNLFPPFIRWIRLLWCQDRICDTEVPSAIHASIITNRDKKYRNRKSNFKYLYLRDLTYVLFYIHRFPTLKNTKSKMKGIDQKRKITMTQLERDFTHAFSQKRKSPIPVLTSKYIAFYPRVEVLEVKHLTQRNIRARKVLRVLQILSFFPCHKILAQTA